MTEIELMKCKMCSAPLQEDYVCKYCGAKHVIKGVVRTNGNHAVMVSGWMSTLWR